MDTHLRFNFLWQAKVEPGRDGGCDGCQVVLAALLLPLQLRDSDRWNDEHLKQGFGSAFFLRIRIRAKIFMRIRILGVSGGGG